ncbi:MAG: hypothetical protein LLH30_14395 [Candidatus Manganitrophus sp. SA1]|nr:hypothetical protein [Candidatus Manganitrophus morganii]
MRLVLAKREAAEEEGAETAAEDRGVAAGGDSNPLLAKNVFIKEGRTDGSVRPSP